VGRGSAGLSRSPLREDGVAGGVSGAEAGRGRCPAALRSPLVTSLGQVYEQLNAPFGGFGQDTLTASTRALNSGSATDDSRYAVPPLRAILENAQAHILIAEARALAQGTS
jgi:hypothetical protein